MVFYFTAEKRLSNEFAGTIGCEPATWAGAAAGAGESDSDGFNGGRDDEACLMSDVFGAAAVAFGTTASGRGGGSLLRLASITFGFAGMAGSAVHGDRPFVG